MGKLITKEDGYEIRLGQKNPTCYPCCFEGSVCACRSDLCIKHRDNWLNSKESRLSRMNDTSVVSIKSPV